MTNKLTTASPAKLDLYLDRLAAQSPSRGRLVFGLDATASRQPLWDRACDLQGEMFDEAARVGGLEIMLVYYGGNTCRASKWFTDGRRLGDVMRRITCVGGFTQIEKILRQVRFEHDKSPVSALVFVGDCMEESLDALCVGAHGLGKRSIKAFMFQEGDNEEAENAFREIARLTHGAYCKFSKDSAQELRDLLRAVAAYASGGIKALGNVKAAGAIKLLEQLKSK
jgi:hypothetical protein